MTIRTALFLTLFISSASVAYASACERHIAAAAKRHGVPVGILYSVGLTETGRKGSLHPYALNIEGKAVFARNLSEALKAFHAARRDGRTLIDLGCMQVNHYYHRDQFADLAAMLDPARNVDYAAKFLARLRGRHESWTMAVARYHAGPDNDPAQRKYVCRVIKNLVATGYGRWTAQAKAFCKYNL
ncbi:transglycosylase SLT domain-containing protein [Hoeflea prorocentri]|uniref:Transglycosylase SLT domain-containing protein n=1 Tax=Hoeflea prorocentri TaxID=1922333 RepID=A0A9X3UJ95_9HYPH|nr:transglycosylase SLT domain-containing protein [Hoeflea prorocentri]MCY6382382.1 transglycosylase SLT domain-containing protein [Hoeflea prorocentri]MDA5400182.1 transglycosylase SLT domain-containing protein [Hoeflea prorocentri]